MSFNAWGQRRKAPSIEDSENYTPIPISEVWSNQGLGIREMIENTTTRGFTGHEHFDQVGIIHMNGRIYDPEIGRFLQADPVVQDPYNTQSLNRYSYVMNNPLSYTDPTGNTRLRKGAGLQIARLAAAIIVTVYSAGTTSELLEAELISAYQAIAISAAAGAVSGAIATGNLKGAVKGAIFAVVTFGIGHGFDGSGGIGEEGSMLRIFAHSVASGVSAEVDGGRFGHGFASAVLTQSLGQGRIFDAKKVGGRAIVSNAILQGTISEITGGKFANGAMSAAFRVAFNEFGGRYERLAKTLHEERVEAENEAMSGGFSPLPADFITNDGFIVSLTVDAEGILRPTDGGYGAYNIDPRTNSNIVYSAPVDAIEGVYPSTWLVGGGVGVGAGAGWLAAKTGNLGFVRFVPQSFVNRGLRSTGWANKISNSTSGTRRWILRQGNGPRYTLQWSAAGGRHGGSYWKLSGESLSTRRSSYFWSKNK